MPPALHLVNGNPGKRAIDLEAGINPLVQIPECPAHLNDAAKTEWKRITRELEPLGLISQIDRAMLALYCQAYGRWVFAENKIRALEKKQAGSGYTQNSPNGYAQMSHWLVIAKQAMEQVHKYAGEFGMSPSARTSVVASANQGKASQPELPGVPAAPTRPTLASINDIPRSGP